jgi:hypothetical protein
MSQDNVLGISSLVYSLHNRIPFGNSISWIKSFIISDKINIRNLYYLGILKVFSSNSAKLTYSVFNYISEKFGKITIKGNLKDIPENYFLELINKFINGKEEELKSLVIRENSFTSMYRLLNFKNVTLLKMRDIDKDIAKLTLEILFKVFPEFDNDHYKTNLTIENFAHNIEFMNDPVFTI